MKKFLLLIILYFTFFIINCFSQSYGWVDISQNVPADSLYSLSDVHFISENEGWITTSWFAEIYHTTNGGESFEIQQTGIDPFGTYAIWMLNENEGYAAVTDGRIIQTFDGGANWIELGYISIAARDVTFPRQSGTTGYAVGDGSIWSITGSFLSQMYEDAVDFYSITFPVDDTEGWVCGSDTILHYTGGSWVGQNHYYPFNGNRAIYFIDNQNGWVVGGKIFHTTDGEHWIKQTIPGGVGGLKDVFFLDSQVGWAVGGVGDIIHTTDGGINWLEEAEGLIYEELYGVYFTSPTNGYIVGENKTLIKYTIISGVDNEKELPEEFSILQNYPNPFNPSTKIKYSIAENRLINIKVYNSSGEEIAVLVNENKAAGNYEVEFNAANLPSGVYFYKLQAGEFIQTRKMILLK